MLCRPESIASAFLRSTVRLAGGAAGELMQDSPADLRIQISGRKLLTLLAQNGNPRFIRRTKLLLQFLPNSLRECRALTSGGDCDLQVSATYNGRVIEVA